MKNSVIFSSALAKAAQLKLLKKEQIIRLSDAADFKEALRMLYDYGYARESGDIDKIMNAQLCGLIAFIEESSPDESFSRIILNPFLYNNAKLYYKARYGAVADLLYVLPDEEIKRGITEQDYSVLPEAITECVKELDEIFKNTPADGSVIDKLFNRAMYRDNLAAAKKSASRPLKKYVIAEIDLNNFVSFIRCRRLKRSWDYCVTMLYEGGKIGLDFFEDNFAADDNKIKELLAKSNYGEVAESILDGKINMDMSIDSVLADFEIMDVMEVGTLAPLLQYVKCQLIEYRVVRMILICIKNNARYEIEKRIKGLYD